MPETRPKPRSLRTKSLVTLSPCAVDSIAPLPRCDFVGSCSWCVAASEFCVVFHRVSCTVRVSCPSLIPTASPALCRFRPRLLAFCRLRLRLLHLPRRLPFAGFESGTRSWAARRAVMCFTTWPLMLCFVISICGHLAVPLHSGWFGRMGRRTAKARGSRVLRSIGTCCSAVPPPRCCQG